MSLYITEYPGISYIAGLRAAIPNASVTTTTVVSSGGTVSTALLAATTKMVEIAAIGVGGWVLFSGSSVSTSVVTSTNGIPIIANTSKLLAVTAGARFTALST